MKTMMKRTFAFLLALVLSLSLLPSVNLTAEAASYIYNWGTRGTTATFLSPGAEAFYEDNNTSYEKLSALSGSSSESSIPSSTLYKTLHNLMESNHKKITSYDGTKSLFQYTDCQNGGGKISSFYSGTGIGPSWNGGWNREHTWPNSKGDKAGSGENDLMMLRPTATSENSSRGNKAYGQSGGYYNPNSESNGRYDLRGDVARIILYVYVRWECTNTGSKYNPNGIFGTNGVFESKRVLLDWMEADPVDTWELGRNDSAESILGTRNVFVDFPELSFILFGEDVPENYTTPSGNGAGGSYTITAVSNNTAWGTVAVSGKTINATPKTGYAISGYTILSGTAEVSRSDNAFTVNPSSDVKVQINFAPRSQNTVQFSQLGVVVNSLTAYTGDTVTLPAHNGTAENDYNFVGWVAGSVEETTTAPAFYAAGSQYAVGADVTMYALYSRFEGGSGSSSTVFERHTGALVEGDYVIIGSKDSDDKAMVAADTGKSRLQEGEVTYTNGQIVAPAANVIWHIARSGSHWTMYNAATDKYAGSTGTDNKATLLSSVTDAAKWTEKVVSGNTYEFTNKGNSDKGVNPLLRRNPGIGFACYATNTNVGSPLKLYKRVAGSVYYFTYVAEAECTHTNAQNEAEQKPTCTEVGYTAGVYCPDCETYLSGHQEVAATGHSFDGDTCTACGAAKGMPGDLNEDGFVNEDDAIYLLRHVLMPENYAVNQPVDYDNSNSVDEDDAIYLLRHVLMPEQFPI